eukprot:TRINITY_DN18226_c0_g1_i1.p1 TRINITY_DN18226_c0_g1~~TRINITY_DN18226_c0_g1_i1.p1  ORF type:complete len:307 (+),score=16.56 TRINITY_DN18226_c0_g1_i1:49-969(+)
MASFSLYLPYYAVNLLSPVSFTPCQSHAPIPRHSSISSIVPSIRPYPYLPLSRGRSFQWSSSDKSYPPGLINLMKCEDSREGFFVQCLNTSDGATSDEGTDISLPQVSRNYTVTNSSEMWLSRATDAWRTAGKAFALAGLIATLIMGAGAEPAWARRREGVNKPELLPSEFSRVIDVAGFLSAGQEERMSRELGRLEDETGFKVRVLAQNYPNTPGLAIKDFWGVDDQTVVLVADPSLSGNILNFNVGTTVDLNVPRSFWSRVSGKYGNMFYWKENGEDVAIEAAVSAIDTCLREPIGPAQCASIQ